MTVYDAKLWFLDGLPDISKCYFIHNFVTKI